MLIANLLQRHGHLSIPMLIYLMLLCRTIQDQSIASMLRHCNNSLRAFLFFYGTITYAWIAFCIG